MISDEEKQIIVALRKNSRQSLRKLAHELNLPVSTIHNKVNRFESGLIHKHTSLVDFKKLGFDSKYFFLIKTTDELRDDLKTFLAEHPSVNNLYITNSEFDFAFEAVFRNSKDFNVFKAEIAQNFSVVHLRCQELIEDLERERFLV